MSVHLCTEGGYSHHRMTHEAMTERMRNRKQDGMKRAWPTLKGQVHVKRTLRFPPTSLVRHINHAGVTHHSRTDGMDIKSLYVKQNLTKITLQNELIHTVNKNV